MKTRQLNPQFAALPPAYPTLAQAVLWKINEVRLSCGSDPLAALPRTTLTKKNLSHAA